jgi:hypothetical protein
LSYYVNVPDADTQAAMKKLQDVVWKVAELKTGL